MISPLADLETRRKILFADESFTVRSIGADAVLITANSKKMSRSGVENVLTFLNNRSKSASISSLIVDVSLASGSHLVETLAFSKLKNQGLLRFAMLSRKFILRLIIPFIVPTTRSTHFRVFRDLASAIAWTRKTPNHN